MIEAPPSFSLSLPAWKEEKFSAYHLGAEQLTKFVSGVGFNSEKTKKKIELMLEASRSGPDSIAELLRCSADIRAYAGFLASEELPAVPVFSREILTKIQQYRPKLNALVLRGMLRAYFTNYESIKTEKGCESFPIYLANQLEDLTASKKDEELSKLSKVARPLLHPQGPRKIAELAARKSIDIDEAIIQLGLSSFKGTTYIEVTQAQYVLHQISQLADGEDGPILHELRKAEFNQTYAGNGCLLGHLALEQLIDRTEGAPSDAWRTAILNVAGDPRVSKSSSRFTTWWSKLGTNRVQKVRGWFSVIDIKLFLDVIQDYGKDAGDEALQRMFPDRKRLLQGLVSQGLVEETRLFLSNRAGHYVQRAFAHTEAPTYATVNDSLHRSMIYMKLQNAVIVEGSHSRTLYILPFLPSESRILDYEVRRFSESELGKVLHALAREEQPALARHMHSITHNGAWHYKAINGLRKLGVKLDPEPLLTPEAYRQYRQEYRL